MQQWQRRCGRDVGVGWGSGGEESSKRKSFLYMRTNEHALTNPFLRPLSPLSLNRVKVSSKVLKLQR